MKFLCWGMCLWFAIGAAVLTLIDSFNPYPNPWTYYAMMGLAALWGIAARAGKD